MEVIDLKVITSLPVYSKCMQPRVSPESYLYNFLRVYWKYSMRAVEIFDPEYRERLAITLIKNGVDIMKFIKLSPDERYDRMIKLYDYRVAETDEVLAQRLVAQQKLIGNTLPLLTALRLVQGNRHGYKGAYSVLNYFEKLSGYNYRDIKWEKLFHITQLENVDNLKTLPFEVADYANNKLYYFRATVEAPAWNRANKQILENRQEQSRFDLVRQHIEKRFRELDQILTRRKKAVVLFPGENSKNHSLGTGIAASAWKDKNIHKRMVNLISELIENMEKKYANRVQFGAVGFKELLQGSPFEKTWKGDPSPDLVHVWGANDSNWNTRNNDSKKILGAAQASVLYQRPGVFGIVTMPTDDKSILDKDVNLEDYFTNLSLVQVSDSTPSQYVAQGGFGCVYTPNIRCSSVQDPGSPIQVYDSSGSGEYLKIRSPDLVSKVFGSSYIPVIAKEIQNEVDESRIIDQIDPDEKFHYGVKAICRIEEQPEQATKCSLEKARAGNAYQIIYEYGGVDFSKYIHAKVLYANVLFSSLQNLFEGLVMMRNSKFSHLDIKALNIVVKTTPDNLKLSCKYIDFGFSKKWEQVIATEVPYIARIYPEDASSIKAYMTMKNKFLKLYSYIYFCYPVEMCFLRLDFFRIVVEYLDTYTPEQLADMTVESNFIPRYKLIATDRVKFTKENEDELGSQFRTNMIAYLTLIKSEFAGKSERNRLTLMNRYRQEILEKVDVYSLGVTILQAISVITTRNRELKDPIIDAMRSLCGHMAHPITGQRYTPQQALKAYTDIVSKYRIVVNKK